MASERFGETFRIREGTGGAWEIRPPEGRQSSR
jgi:hypothetical protein